MTTSGAPPNLTCGRARTTSTSRCRLPSPASFLQPYPKADADIVSLALLLHDIGWWQIDMNDIIEKGFGPNMMQSDVRFLHEREGVRLSREVLKKTGWPRSRHRGGRRDHRRPRHAAARALAQRPTGARCRQALALHRHRRCRCLRLVQDDAAPYADRLEQASFHL